MSRKKRIGNLTTQKVLSWRVFDPRIYEKLEMVELVENMRHQGWLHLLDELFQYYTLTKFLLVFFIDMMFYYYFIQRS